MKKKYQEPKSEVVHLVAKMPVLQVQSPDPIQGGNGEPDD